VSNNPWNLLSDVSRKRAAKAAASSSVVAVASVG
jgi:hypothetical protein